MSEIGGDVRLSPRERSQLVAQALAEAARRARFSSRGRRALRQGGYQARSRQRFWRVCFLATFAAIVVIPTLVASVYYAFIASDQYVSESRFTLRTGTPPKIDSLSAMTGIPSMLIVQDTLIVTDFLYSRALLEKLEKSIQLREMFARPEIDGWARFDPDKPIEKFVKYWKSMIDVSIKMPAGIVVVTVRAFSPQDSLKIANALLEASESLVNDMNERMQHDAVGLSLQEQKRASDRLLETRVALERARNTEGMLNAEETHKSINELITGVQSGLLKLQQQYDSQIRFVAKTAPQMRTLQQRIDAAKEQITALKAQLTQNDEAQRTKTLSSTMSTLDYLELERKIAERIYEGATTAVEKARLTSESKLMYLNIYVTPVLAEEARYPHRVVNTLLVFLSTLAIWGAVWGLLSMARNHKA
ncbi:hypothetical protein [Beijerinckia mobilis]|uniref:hypothetical protein n=1 Tax=Beijerinckia mobilis TaxID=231434 RepID=UPI000550AC66|nr:hypothetical protein [Beijerinckia mobilis]